jgi:myo-inositol-1(or 4)-monophosphatase
MARYLLPSTNATASSLPSRDAKASPAPILSLRGLASRSKHARPILAVASEQPAAASKFPKVAAPTTGPIPADELLGVIQAAAKAGAEVRLRFFFFHSALPCGAGSV